METVDTSSLTNIFTSASWYSERSTILVAIGVFIELAALFIFSKEMPRAEKTVLVLATALITIGCVGEYIFGSRANNSASQLQQASDRTVAALTGQQETDHRIATQAAAQQADAELATMQAVNTPRDLSTEQQGEFSERMTPFAGLAANVFTPPSTTPDAGPLAEMLATLLSKANWKVGSGTPIGGWAKFVLVCIGDTPKPNVEAAATAIVMTLRADGIQSFIDSKLGPNIPLTGTGSPVQNPDMTIIVGAKQ